MTLVKHVLLLFCFSFFVFTSINAQINSSNNIEETCRGAGQLIKISDQKATLNNYGSLSIVADKESISSLGHMEMEGGMPGADCSFLWSDVVFGNCNGRSNSFIPYDHGGDGTIELFVNANAFSDSGFWYLLKYNPLTNGYEKIANSLLFPDEAIYKMALLDLDNSGEKSLVFGHESILYVVDPESFETLAVHDFSDFLSGWAHIRQLILEDAEQ